LRRWMRKGASLLAPFRIHRRSALSYHPLLAQRLHGVANVVGVLGLAQERALDVVGVGLVAPGARLEVAGELILPPDELFVAPQRLGELAQHAKPLLADLGDLRRHRLVFRRQVTGPPAVGVDLGVLDALVDLLDLASAALDLDRVLLDGP